MKASDVAVRAAIAGDAPSLAALAAELGYPSTPGELTMRLGLIAEMPHHAVFAAESEGAVVGWVHVVAEIHLESGRFGEVAGLVVKREFRGKGVGRRLLAEAETWARGEGLSSLRVRSNVVRRQAHAFYEREGYAFRKEQAVFEKTL